MSPGMCHKRPMKTTAEPISSQQRSTEALAPIRAWAKGNQGAIGDLAEEVARITGEPANRHMVGRWIREKNPVQPRFGYGLALLEAYDNLARYAQTTTEQQP